MLKQIFFISTAAAVKVALRSIAPHPDRVAKVEALAAQIEELELQKQQSVANEDYAEAERLKWQILGLQAKREAIQPRMFYYEMYELQAQRLRALKNNDQDLASQLQEDINGCKFTQGAISYTRLDLPADIFAQIEELERSVQMLITDYEPDKAAERKEDIARILREYEQNRDYHGFPALPAHIVAQKEELERSVQMLLKDREPWKADERRADIAKVLQEHLDELKGRAQQFRVENELAKAEEVEEQIEVIQEHYHDSLNF